MDTVIKLDRQHTKTNCVPRAITPIVAFMKDDRWAIRSGQPLRSMWRSSCQTSQQAQVLTLA